MLTETLANVEELIFVDYLMELGYQKEALLYKKRIFHTFYVVALEAAVRYRMFLLFENLGSVSKENYELYFGTDIGYEFYLEKMYQWAKNNKFDFYFYTSYVMGAILAPYLYSEYKKDPAFMKKITLLHDKINNSTMLECLKLINLNDFGEEGQKLLAHVLKTIVNELIQESKKVLVKKL